MNSHCLKLLLAASLFALANEAAHGQVSELYIISSPNVIYPVGNTSVYQSGSLLRKWTHATSYELSIAVVGGSVRQSAVEAGFRGTEYTLSGALTGRIFPAAPAVFDAASDGSSIFGWDVNTATLKRYDLDWRFQQNLFSLGSAYDHAYMGITYDLESHSIWLAPLSTGSIVTHGYLYNYSLTGNLLGTLALANSSSTGSGLAYDPADNTLWFFNWGAQRFEQYAKNGELLSTLTGMTRVHGAEFVLVPEPAVSGLFGIAALVVVFNRQRRS